MDIFEAQGLEAGNSILLHIILQALDYSHSGNLRSRI
jgi:hypothetical protein